MENQELTNAQKTENAEKRFQKHVEIFRDLCTKSIDEQQQYFLKSFIFELDKEWKNVNVLASEWKYLCKSNGDSITLSEAAAMGICSKNNRNRTAKQFKDEVKDLNISDPLNIPFITFLLIFFKPVVVKSYYKRVEQKNPYTFNDEEYGAGLVGLYKLIIEELSTMPGQLSPELEEAIEEFMKFKRERAKKMQDLEEQAAAGGVKGKTAANELEQMKAADTTAFNQKELSLEAAKRRALKSSGEEQLRVAKAKHQAEEKKQRDESRNNLASRAAKFQ